MRLAVMQPYFFPYLGYFQLIHSVEKFMFFDDVQYLKKSWMSRNRLLDLSSNNPYYIRPSLQKSRYKELLLNVQLEKQGIWKEKLFAQLNGYKNKTPFYEEVITLLAPILSFPVTSLSDFNRLSVIEISQWLDLNVKFEKFSDYEWDFTEKPGKGEWGLLIAEKMGASHYINAPGGEEFISVDDFRKKGIKLGFIQPQLAPYSQSNCKFVPALSILDVVFFNGKEGTKKLLQNYSIKWKN